MSKYARLILIAILALAGTAHFAFPEEFAHSIPERIGSPYFWIYLTGIIEFAAILGLINRKLRLATSYLLILYFLALLPAHFEMVINNGAIFGLQNKTFFIARIFMQIIPIFLAWEARKGFENGKPKFLEKHNNIFEKRFKDHSGWHNKWMLAAAFYNIGWGAWVVVYPDQAFRLFSMQVLEYEFIWQTVGMIVGVYGLAYYFAAMDLKRFYPILLIGTLGKIFGPIGFVQHYFLGNIPLEFGTLLIFNDLIWWPAFFAASVKYFKPFFRLENLD